MPVPTAVPPAGKFARRRGCACSARARHKLDLPGVAAELLAQADRRGVGQMRAADLDDVVPLLGLVREHVVEVRSSGGIRSLWIAMADGDVDGGREHVVGRLPHVDVIVGMDRLLVRRSASPAISMARLVMTSLAFMFDEVPEPVW